MMSTFTLEEYRELSKLRFELAEKKLECERISKALAEYENKNKLHPVETIPLPNPRPVEVLAYIPKLVAYLDNPNKTGWAVGWAYDDMFCTPGIGFALESVEGWMYLPETPTQPFIKILGKDK